MKCINKLKDNQYPYTYIDHTRIIARAFLLNDKNEVCLLKIEGKDDFGNRNYYETPGGGVDKDESLKDAVIREVKEETGYNSIVLQELGYVEDYYNLIHRHNINNYFLLKATSYDKTDLLEYEKTIIKEVKWFSLEEAILKYENMNKEKLEILVKNRELQVLLEVYEIIRGEKYERIK